MHFQSSIAIAKPLEELEDGRSSVVLVNLVIISWGLKGCKPVALKLERIFSGVNKVF